MAIRRGTQVKWKWGTGWARGRVEQTFDRRITRTIKGEEITRLGEPGNLALYIAQPDGDRVLKLASEVERA